MTKRLSDNFCKSDWLRSAAGAADADNGRSAVRAASMTRRNGSLHPTRRNKLLPKPEPVKSPKDLT